MIKRIISERNAGLAMLVLFSLIVVFHLLVLSGIIPYDIAWGGRLKSREEMFVFESVSILLNTLMMSVVAVRIKFLKISISQKLVTGILWAMTTLFAVNTIGNLFAVNSWETIIFTPITMVLSLFSLRLAFANN
jgi:hypothetical protein